MVRKVLLNTIKFSFAAGLLWWLIQSGKLDWNLLHELKRYPERLMLAFCLLVINLALCTWRWSLLLSTRSQSPLGFGRLLMVNWVGMFFSSTLPGSVTGDVLKVFYVKKKDQALSTPFLLFSCFVDRLMGLAGLILLIGVNSLMNYQALTALSPQVAPLLNFNFLLLSGLLASLGVYFLFPQSVEWLLAQAQRAMPENSWTKRLANLWSDLSQARSRIGQCVLISLVVQFIGALIFHLVVSPHYHHALELMVVLSFIPLGFIAVALPIAPGGLGVGHAAFQSLFSLLGESHGANFFNMYFVVFMFFNLLGIIPWLAMRRR